MKIKENSILRNLPQYEKRSLLILDSVRFTFDMIAYSHEKLDDCLSSLSQSDKPKKVPESFMYAWNIVDHSQRLLKIIQNLPSDSGHSKVGEILDEVRVPRNTYQHLDERIDECLITKEIPFYGKLKWCYSAPNENSHVDCFAISGTHFSPSTKVTVGEYSNIKVVDKIILETSNRTESIDINISSLTNRVRLYISELEDKIERQTDEKSLDRINRKSLTDIVVILRGENE